jgi:catechol 2,3-dioxygenase-like lactoylglutathione lyase family enzyme
MEHDFLGSGVEMTHILVTKDLESSKNFYSDILGARIYREYGDTSCVLDFQGSWLLLVTGGGPTEDKPEVTFTHPKDMNYVSHAMTIRVTDCRKSYDILHSRGAEFLTPPVDRGSEIRCFFRDPDGHLLEISEVR